MSGVNKNQSCIGSIGTSNALIFSTVIFVLTIVLTLCKSKKSYEVNIFLIKVSRMPVQ